MPRKPSPTPTTNPTSTSQPQPWPPATPSLHLPPPQRNRLLLSYAAYARPRDATTERGVLTFEPYKATLLPHWRFATVSAARDSSQKLLQFFEYYEAQGDWVGCDMARKFIQMGVTRARRYANYTGGRKYVRNKDGERTGKRKGKGVVGGVVVGVGDGDGRDEEDERKRREKLEASEVFRGVLEKVKGREWYVNGRDAFWETVRGLREEGWSTDGDGVIGDAEESVERDGVKKMAGQASKPKRKEAEEEQNLPIEKDEIPRRSTRSTAKKRKR